MNSNALFAKEIQSFLLKSGIKIRAKIYIIGIKKRRFAEHENFINWLSCRRQIMGQYFLKKRYFSDYAYNLKNNDVQISSCNKQNANLDENARLQSVINTFVPYIP
jgi:hypothetical protein